MRSLRLVELSIEKIERLLDLADLLDQPVVRRVPAELNVGSVSSSLESSLGHLERSLLVSDGLLQLLDVFLLEKVKIRTLELF
jgi:hypothetical protein